MDRVNGTMYDKFSVGYKVIPEKATIIPQFQQIPVEDEYRPTYENTLPGITDPHGKIHTCNPGITNACVNKCPPT